MQSSVQVSGQTEWQQNLSNAYARRKPMLSQTQEIAKFYDLPRRIKQADKAAQNPTQQQKQELLKSKRFKWMEQYKSELSAEKKQTKDDSTTTMVLHYCNLMMEVVVMQTQIQEFIDYNGGFDLKIGYFGLFKKPEGTQICDDILEQIPLYKSKCKWGTQNAFRIYFLYCLADILGINAKIYPLVGYDVLITKYWLSFVIKTGSVNQKFEFEKFESEKKHIEPFSAWKLTQILYPSSKVYKFDERVQAKRQVIERLWSITADSKDLVLFSQKVRRALIYLYEHLESFECSSTMAMLRILFILIQDWRYAEKAQKLVLELQSQPFLFALKYTEFLLFRICSRRGQQSVSQNRVQYLQEILNQKQSQVKQKHLKLLEFLKAIEGKSMLHRQTDENKKRIFDLLSETSKACKQKEQNKCIKIVMYIFMDLCGVNQSFFDKKVPRSLSLSVYSKCFVEVDAIFDENRQGQLQLFLPVSNGYSPENLLIGQCEIWKKTQPIGSFIEKMVVLRVDPKNQISYIINGLKEYVQKKPQPSEIRQRLSIINQCLELININAVEAQKHGGQLKKLTKAELAELLETLRRIFADLKNLKALEESDQTRLQMMIAQMKLNLYEGGDIAKQLSDIAAVFESGLQHPSCLLQIFAAYHKLRPHLQNQMKAGHSGPSFKADLLKILDSYTKRPSVFSKIKTFSSYLTKALTNKSIIYLDMLVANLFNDETQDLEKNERKMIICMTVQFFQSENKD